LIATIALANDLRRFPEIKFPFRQAESRCPILAKLGYVSALLQHPPLPS
jgi:hypothetical protein